MAKKILHLGSASAFMPEFIKMIEEEFDSSAHDFILITSMADEKIRDKKNVHLFKVKTITTFFSYLKIALAVLRADKVMLHGLNDPRLIILLWFMPFLHKKLYWFIWGADLYTKVMGKKNLKWRVREFFRKTVIKRMGYLVTYIPDDVEKARAWYGAQGEYRECLMYQSNVVDTELLTRLEDQVKGHRGTNILVGNSADPANNHTEVLHKLVQYTNEDICIFAPLSYGDNQYVSYVIEQGKKMFGDKFIPLTEFMPIKDYLKLLMSIDVAVFNHKLQQAMGNTINLLGMGAAVYIRPEVSQWKMLRQLGVKVLSCHELSLNALPNKCQINNIEIIRSNFSVKNLVMQYKNIFEV